MAEAIAPPTQGLLDTSVVIDMDRIDVDLLPDESAIASITLAELVAGPHAALNATERANRQDRLQLAAQTWDPLPFDTDAARMYGRIFSAMRVSRRSTRSRLADLLIASTAASNELALYTRNPNDFVGLEEILTVKTV
ncbi:MAG: type II toxin-antitoxin system VapC family toxin [Gammaproteobacteria bacterium]|nr:type II toxin-antitoxin system VapC family toxin [Gammaproteobacteria bacterium]MDE0223747.1 type II toxin-antitoxin system VapC family toxin [Gammaproteobacteria bacterium]MDE0451571.1 type II toxin-antitoxin system VapC family toxin [Gammaproteobacteria bacterium]